MHPLHCQFVTQTKAYRAMDYKKKDSERATNGRELEDDYMHIILFAAGATLAMACLKRIIMMFFIEKWQARVFLILNLVLLAIFFTSNRSTSSENQESNDNVEMKIEKKKKRKQCGWSSKVKAFKECHKLGDNVSDAHELEQEQLQVDNVEPKLSKEELNERVEAFITMFRQHLVTDARRGRAQYPPRPKQTDTFKPRKGSYLDPSKSQIKE